MSKYLSEAQVARYDREGYLCPLPGIGAGEAGRLARRLADFEAETGLTAGHVIRNKGHLKLLALYELIFQPAILDAVESVLGPDILCWGSSLFVKEAGDPAFVAWHQDSYYWGLDPAEVCSAWIALKPSTRQNGAMRVIPGSHGGEAMALAHQASAPDSANMLFTHEEIAVEVDEAVAVDLLLEQGEMSLHHVKIVHGSPPNRSAERRIGYAIRYVAPHVRQRGDMNSATLVRGRDPFGHFAPEPVPARDMDPAIVAFVDAPLGGLPKAVAERP